MELGDVDWVNVGTAGANDHGIRAVRLNDSNGFCQGQQSGRVTAGDGVIGAAGVVIDGNVAGWHIGKLTQQPERRDPPNGFGTPFVRIKPVGTAADFDDCGQFLRVAGHSTGTEDHTKTFGVKQAIRNACVLHRQR